jgi:hypothetical protein
MKVEILPPNRKPVTVEIVKFSDTKNHSEKEKKMKRRIKEKIKIKDKDKSDRSFPDVSLHDLYTPTNIIFVIELRRKRGRGTWYSWGRGEYKGLVGKTEGKRPLGKPKPRWEDNTKMEFQEV